MERCLACEAEAVGTLPSCEADGQETGKKAQKPQRKYEPKSTECHKGQEGRTFMIQILPLWLFG